MVTSSVVILLLVTVARHCEHFIIPEWLDGFYEIAMDTVPPQSSA